jgi:hypothetical protein
VRSSLLLIPSPCPLPILKHYKMVGTCMSPTIKFSDFQKLLQELGATFTSTSMVPST